MNEDLLPLLSPWQARFPMAHKDCKAFLRHKMTVINPQVLIKQDNIPVFTMTQEAGEVLPISSSSLTPL